MASPPSSAQSGPEAAEGGLLLFVPNFPERGLRSPLITEQRGAGRMYRGAPCPGRQGAQGWEDSGARRDPGSAGVPGGGVWGGVLASLPLALSLLLRA